MEKFFLFLIDHWMLTTAFLVILMFIVLNEMRRKLLGFSDLSPQDAVVLINKQDALVLDVRDESEFKSGHIVNARNIPVALLETQLNELESSRERPLLIVCKTGQRSARASSLLKKQGFTNVFKLGGGMLAWQGASLPSVKS